MVLRNAPRNPVVDSSHRGDLRARTLSRCHRIPALLQLPRRLCQIPVLAAPHHIPLLWQTKSRPDLPRVLSAAILATPRGILWPLPGAFRLAHFVCNHLSPHHLAVSIPALPGHCLELESGVHLGATESGDAIEFPRAVGLSGAVPAVGAHGV